MTDSIKRFFIILYFILVHTKYPEIKEISGYYFDLFFLLVELEGFEPSSKQGTNLLSTCLSLLRLSGMGKTKATNPNLSFFNFR